MAMAPETATGMDPTVTTATVPAAATVLAATALGAATGPVTDMAKARPPVAATGIPTATATAPPHPFRSTCARSSRRC